MTLRLLGLCADRPLTPGRFLVLILLEVESTPGLELLVQLKNAITSPGIEPATFRLVA
jgi:hypothetical protein